MSESSLYEPGAILDSQTTDSQWADNLGGPPQYATQEHQSQIKEEVDESAADTEGMLHLHLHYYFFGFEIVRTGSISSPPSPLLPLLSPEHTVMEEIKSRINKIVSIRFRELQDERDTLILVLNATNEELESVNQENASVVARRDILLEELELERRWISALERTLKDNNITLPKYPRRM